MVYFGIKYEVRNILSRNFGVLQLFLGLTGPAGAKAVPILTGWPRCRGSARADPQKLTTI